MVKSYTVETVYYEKLVNNIMKIHEIIRLISDKYEMKTNLHILECFFSYFRTTVYKEGDTDFKEVILINLFPDLHK